MDANDGSW